MNIKPLGKKYIIDPIINNVTEGGIVIPDSIKSNPDEGVVVSVGSDECIVDIGKTVIFGRYIGQEIEYDNKKYLLLDESDILAVRD